jgi:hypothetical protein
MDKTEEVVPFLDLKKLAESASNIVIPNLREELGCADCPKLYPKIEECLLCYDKYQKKQEALEISSRDFDGGIALEL